jgi:hypothetical protein
MKDVLRKYPACLGIYIFAKEPLSVSEAGYLSESA